MLSESIILLLRFFSNSSRLDRLPKARIIAAFLGDTELTRLVTTLANLEGESGIEALTILVALFSLFLDENEVPGENKRQ